MLQYGPEWSDGVLLGNYGVRLGPMGSGGVISHTDSQLECITHLMHINYLLYSTSRVYRACLDV